MFGLKWPPVDVQFPLMSPLSCTWNPWFPSGFRLFTVPTILTGEVGVSWVSSRMPVIPLFSVPTFRTTTALNGPESVEAYKWLTILVKYAHKNSLCYTPNYTYPRCSLPRRPTDANTNNGSNNSEYNNRHHSDQHHGLHFHSQHLSFYTGE